MLATCYHAKNASNMLIMLAHAKLKQHANHASNS